MSTLQTYYKNFVLITLGTGIGGGVIIDNKLYEGALGSAGEFGHLYSDDAKKYMESVFKGETKIESIPTKENVDE